MGSKVTRVILACVLWSLASAATPPAAPPKVAGAVGSGRAANLKVSPVVARWMRTMTLRDEVAQLVFIPFHGQSPNPRSREYRKFMRLITQSRIGGLVLNNIANGRVVGKADPYQVATFLNKLQRISRVPLMVGADFERGASMRIDGTTMFPHAMAFGAAGDPGLVRFEGEVTAREARALGVHWVYYPVADVNNNPENPIINIRSFGENPEAVAALVQAFIEGAHTSSRNYVLTTAKHFPGHGDTAVDTHLNLATVPADRQRLNRLELVPFRAAIAAGVDSIMTAHVAVPALAPANLPATLSPAILTDLLRKDLGFKGLVVTDALDMGGIANGYASGEACVLALEAGADALLMPADPEAAISAVVAAVQSGRLKRARIEESVAKLLAAKEKVGLDRNRLVNLNAIHAAIDSPAANEGAQQAADRAVTLVRNRSNLIPLSAPERACYVVMPESRTSLMGQSFTQEVKRRAPSAVIATLDPSLTRQQIDDALTPLTGCESYVVAAFTTASASRGTAGLGGELPHAFDAVWAIGKPLVLVALGNPYLLRAFPGVPAYLATFSTVRPSEIAAVRALWGEIPIDGRMPVSIPGIAAYGEGIHTAVTRKPGQ